MSCYLSVSSWGYRSVCPTILVRAFVETSFFFFAETQGGLISLHVINSVFFSPLWCEDRIMHVLIIIIVSGTIARVMVYHADELRRYLIINIRSEGEFRRLLISLFARSKMSEMRCASTANWSNRFTVEINGTSIHGTSCIISRLHWRNIPFYDWWLIIINIRLIFWLSIAHLNYMRLN